MQIAVTSQNRRNISEHAGKCRNFWIFQIDEGAVANKFMVELPLEQSFHNNHHDLPKALVNINVLITGSMGNGLHQRLMQNGILSVITLEENPDAAVLAFLKNNLDVQSIVQSNHCHAHHH
ncbi:MAG: NifB/NifX family molybdenum-iron cluster-binding protein [Azonexus sp.]|nr:NifB/NifX family molybdenum-iron cluster-binding protein [Azonexus sp.]